MNRQRTLERAGWTFWRCFASTWCLRKHEVFEELVEHLTRQGIEPLGALERLPSIVEYREWVSTKDAAEKDVIDDVIDNAVAVALDKRRDEKRAQI
jgi:hypothetical protein